MVFLVQMTHGLNEKGHGKRLPWCQMFVDMIREVARHRMRRALHVLYCDDGKGQVWNIKDCIERKVLQQLLSDCLPGLDIFEIQFSFHNENALELLQKADIFYFKGFGGGTQQLLPIFGQPFLPEMA